jgi:hypothetical protein
MSLLELLGLDLHVNAFFDSILLSSCCCSSGGVGALRWCSVGGCPQVSWWCWCQPELLLTTTGGPVGVAGVEYKLLPLSSSTWTSPISQCPLRRSLFVS